MADSLSHIDADREDEFIEWCQTKFMEITEGRDYTRSTRTKEERVREEGSESGEKGGDVGETEGEEEEKENGIGLGAALKYLAQGWEPTKPPPHYPHRPGR